MVTHRLTNNKAPTCNLPDVVTVSTDVVTGNYRADNTKTKQMGLQGVYQIKPSDNNYEFKYNSTIDPNDPNKGQPEVTAPPLIGQSIGWNFNATPKAVCPTSTTATANGQSNPQVCVGQPINLATPAVTNATGYQWFFPDGSTRSEQNPVIPGATL